MKHLVMVVAVVVIGVVSFFMVETLAGDPVCVDTQSGQCQFVVTSSSESSEELHQSSAVLYSIMGSVAVGLTGIIPLIWIPSQEEERKENKVFMNRALSFAAGALLGDVFLHILPESLNVAGEDVKDYHKHTVYNGVLILIGIITFFMLEKILSFDEIDDAEPTVVPPNLNGNNNVDVRTTENERNGHTVGQTTASDEKSERQEEVRIQSAGYLNLFANCLDNFTHGLAIGGSFLVSRKFGLMTTAAILLHEIPHEFGDFAILLRAGFERWRAAKLQVFTATGGLFGALFAHIIDARSVWWILPFTAGGFLHIALCTIIPDLMKDTASKKESFIQFCILVFSVSITGWIGMLE